MFLAPLMPNIASLPELVVGGEIDDRDGTSLATIASASRRLSDRPWFREGEGVRRMSQQWMPGRRAVVKGLGTAALVAGAGGLARPARAADLVVGFIYVGPKDDYGYNQAHAEGAAACKSMAGVKIVEEENVAETIDVQKTMESMINLDGATLLFPTSFGYFDQ